MTTLHHHHQGIGVTTWFHAGATTSSAGSSSVVVSQPLSSAAPSTRGYYSRCSLYAKLSYHNLHQSCVFIFCVCSLKNSLDFYVYDDTFNFDYSKIFKSFFFFNCMCFYMFNCIRMLILLYLSVFINWCFFFLQILWMDFLIYLFVYIVYFIYL